MLGGSGCEPVACIVSWGDQPAGGGITYKADRTPCEQRGETGQGEQPVKDDTAAGGEDDVRQRTESQVEEDGHQGPATSVNVSEDFGCVALLGHCGQRSGAAEDAGDAD